MATVNVALSKGMNGYPTTTTDARVSEVITSSGTSQASTSLALGGEVVTITASGGNVWVKIGAAPTAEEGGDWLVLDGTTRYFAPTAAGDVVAVIDA